MSKSEGVEITCGVERLSISGSVSARWRALCARGQTVE